jgi:putative transposase
VKYAFIKENYNAHGIRRLCEVLDVSTSGYYDWVERPESQRSKENRRLVTHIKCHHQASQRIYGSPRIHQDLIDSDESVGVNRVARLMRQENIQSKVAKRFVITTESKHSMEPAPDRVPMSNSYGFFDIAWSIYRKLTITFIC